jgi:hypothetical protein
MRTAQNGDIPSRPRDNGQYTIEEEKAMRWLDVFKPSGSTHLRRAGGTPSHGVGHDPGMPHLAAAQIPGPGAGRMLAGETGALPDDAADPVEREGHTGARSRRGRRHRRER